MDILIEIIGWTGSLLVVVSLAQGRPARLHVLNVTASAILIFYNWALEVYPGVGLNIALFAVNSWRLWVLWKKHKNSQQEVVESAE